ncbi:MAG: SdrD B-like domain-containing protein [Gemmataceae bacterium]
MRRARWTRSRRHRPQLEQLEQRLAPDVGFGFAVGVGGTGDEEGLAIATDATGQAHVAGRFQGAVDFDPGPGQALLTSQGDSDLFVARYNESGGLVWARRVGGPGSDAALGVGVDAAGNVYVTGTFRGTVDFDPGPGLTFLTSAGDSDAFVLKLDSTGTFQWARRLGNGGSDEATALVVSPLGTVFLTGRFQGSVDFDPGAGTTILTSAGPGDLFLASLDTTGAFAWATRLGGTDDDRGRALARDAAGNLVVGGSFEGNLNYQVGISPASLPSAGGSDGLLARFSPTGSLEWLQGLGGTASDQVTAVAVDFDSNVLVAGTFEGSAILGTPLPFVVVSSGQTDVFVAKTTSSGFLSWAVSLGNTAADEVRGLATDGNNGVYLTGAFGGTVDFDPSSRTTNRTSAGFTDLYVAKLESNGLFNWVVTAGGAAGSEIGRAIAVDARGGVLTTGSYRSTVDFDPGAATQVRVTAGGSDLFVTRWTQPIITGSVWSDTNGNGLRDPGEAPLAGVRIELGAANGDPILTYVNNPLLVTTSGVDGTYQLVGPLPANGYYLDLLPPTGLALTLADAGKDARDSDFNPVTGRTPVFTLTTTTTLDAGLVSIAPRVGFVQSSSSSQGMAYPVASRTDSAGNVYVLGTYTGTFDLAPGSGMPSLTSAGLNDVFLSKWNAAGTLLWVRSFGGTGNDVASDLVLDSTGVLWLGGTFETTADLDPGPGVASVTSNGSTDVFVCKLDAGGNLVVARTWGGTSPDSLDAMALDLQNALYLTGLFQSPVDFDPSNADTTLIPNGQEGDVYLSKLDAAGLFAWATAFTASTTGDTVDVGVDASGAVYLTGTFYETVDFDPGSGFTQRTSAGNADVFVSKFDTLGNFTWVQTWGSTGKDSPAALVLGSGGDLFLTGTFSGTVDFDPGATTVSLTSAGPADVFLTRFTSNGNLTWARAFGGGSSERPSQLTLDDQGNLLLTGQFTGTVDFDPGVGIFSLTSASPSDAFVSLLTPAGQFLWARSFRAASAASPLPTAVDAQGNIVLAGALFDTTDLDPGLSISSAGAPGTSSFFLVRWTPTEITGTLWRDLDADGRREPNEPFLPGITVALLDANAPGTQLATTTTNDTGFYRFRIQTPLAAGYAVQIIAPGGLEFTRPDVLDDALDSDVTALGSSPILSVGFGNPTLDAGLTETTSFFNFALATGGYGDDLGSTVTTDAAGNIYVAGEFTGTVDFDPGPGVTQLINPEGSGMTDAFIASYTPTGQLRWVKAFQGSLYAAISSITLDSQGNVITTGYFRNIHDFDPGPGVQNLSAVSYADIFISKLDPAGNFLWVKHIPSVFPNYNFGTAVAVDPADNIIVAGTFWGTTDFDPGNGVFEMTSNGLNDAYVMSLTPDGTFRWAKQFGAGLGEEVDSIAVNGTGIYLTGNFQGTVDFNPGTGVDSLTSAGSFDAYLLRLDLDGNFGWARRMGGSQWDYGYGVARWSRQRLHHRWVLERCHELRARHPHPGQRHGNFDVFVARFNAAGDFQWAQRFGNTGEDRGLHLAADAFGNLFVSGMFTGSVDADPGSGQFVLTSAGASDAFVTRLDANGTFVWARSLGGSSADEANGVAVDARGTVTISGSVTGSADLAPGLGLPPSVSNGQKDFFVSQYRQVELTGVLWNDLDGDGLRDDGEPGLQNLRVDLFDPSNNTGTPVATVYTNSDGVYRISSPPNRSVYLQVTPSSTLALVGANQGSDSNDSDFLPASGRTALFTPSAFERVFDGGLVPVSPVLDYAYSFGAGANDEGQVVVTDSAGNVYIAGKFNGTVDFDPGPAQYLLSGQGAFVACYTPEGVPLWVSHLAGPDPYINIAGLAVDASGQVVVAGSFVSTVDLDPGPGEVNFSTTDNSDLFILKLSSAGGYVWARRFGSAFNDSIAGVGLDAAGNIYFTGIFRATADFDPGPGTLTLTSAGVNDAFLAKLTDAGNLVWARRFGGTDSEEVASLAVTPAGDVALVGRFNQTVDFDPGPGVTNLTSDNSYDLYIARFTSAGTLAWARRIGSSGYEQVHGVAMDPLGNVYFTGEVHNGTIDFDPGPLVTDLTAPPGDSLFVAKLSAGGDYVWARLQTGGVLVQSKAITVDASGNVYTTGLYYNPVDFDPGPGSYVLSGASGGDIFVSKLDAAGRFVSAFNFVGNSFHGGVIGQGIAVDPSGNIYTTGRFFSTVDFDPGPGVLPLTGVGNEIFLTRLNVSSEIRGVAWQDLNGDGLRDATEPLLAGVTVDLFDSVNGWLGSDLSLGQVQTGPDGSYLFSDPPRSAKGYYLVFRAPGGLAFTSSDQGDDTRDSDVLSSTGETDLFAWQNALQRFDVGFQVSQTPSSQGFAQAITGTGALEVRSAATDADGNVYVVGSFRGTVDMDAGPGEYLLTSAGGSDIVVGCYSVGGSLLWTYRLGGTSNDLATGLALFPGGGHAVVGTFSTTVDFDPGPASTELISAGGTDVFAYVMDVNGRLVWARQVGGTADDVASGVAVNNAGQVFVVGDFAGQVDFDPAPTVSLRTSYGPRDAFVWKLSSVGALVWVLQAGGITGNDTATAVAVEPTGAVLVTGNFQGAADFDPGAGVLDLVSAGGRDIFVWRLDDSGNALWARRAGGTGDDLGLAITRATGGVIYVTGSFTGTADFDPGAGLAELTSAGDTDVYVWKLTALGGLSWARALGGPATDLGRAIVADDSGVYLTGAFQDTADFDPGQGFLPLSSVGGFDAFAVKLDAAGNRQWGRRLGGNADDQGRTITVDASSRVTFLGSAVGAVRFNPGDGELLLSGTGPQDAFLARINQAALPATIRLDALESNNTPSTATNLGVINARQEIDKLTLHAADDEDWFRFDLLSPPVAGQRVRIDFLNSQGNLTLELYAGGSRLRLSATSGNFEEISLAGLQVGTYLVRVLGAANPQYKLTLVVPEALTPDAREPNDDAGAATDLGTPTEAVRLTNLTIHTAIDADWFRFTTLAAGTASSFVRIDFRNAQGDLDLELRDANGVLLRQSSGAADAELISLAGLPAGTYFACVVGHNGALSPAYSVTVDPPRPLVADSREPNNTRGTATALGTVRGTLVVPGLSIHTDTDSDWFQFIIVARGSASHAVRIDFPGAHGDLDLRLYDAAGTLLATSASNADSERISLLDRLAGTYFVQVVGYQGATQAGYQLSLVTPTGAASQPDRLEGPAGNNSRPAATQVRSEGQPTLSGFVELSDLNLHTGSDQDWFQFTTTGKAGLGHRLVLDYDLSGGNLDLELYNAAGTRLLTSSGNNGIEIVSLNNLTAGTYLARVFSPAGAASNYSLAFDTPTTTLDAWTIQVFMAADNLPERAFADLNELEQAAARLPGNVNLAVFWDQPAALRTYQTSNGSQPAWGTVGRALIVPDTDPDRLATRFEILPEQNTGNPTTLRNFVTWARTVAPSQKSALIVWDHGSALRGTSFDRFDGQASDWLSPAELLAALNGLPAFDMLAFDACFQATLEQTYQLRNIAGVVVGSQDIIPGDGFEYDEVFAQLESNPASVTGAGLASALVRSYGERYGRSGNGDTLSAVRTADLPALVQALAAFSAQVTSATPLDRTRLVGLAGTALTHHRSADYARDVGDFFRLVADNTSLATSLRNAAWAVQTALEAAVLSRTDDARDSSGLSLYLPAVGTDEQVSIRPTTLTDYASEYASFATDSAWLSALNLLSTAGQGRPDGHDYYDRVNPRTGNDQPSTASDLRQLTIPVQVAQLNLLTSTDEDWFRFEVVASEGSTLQVDVTVGPAGGNLSVQLCDADGTPLVTETTSTTTTLTLIDLSAGQATYFLRFFSTGGEVGSYGFQLTPPLGEGSDWAGANNTRAKAYPLPVRPGEVLPGLVLEAGAQDWFRFATPILQAAELHQVEITAAGAVLAQVRDDRGIVLAQAQGTGTLLLPYTQLGKGEKYSLVLINAGSAPVPYALRFAPSSYTTGPGFARDGFSTGDSTRPGAPDWQVTGTWTIQGQRARSASASGRLLRTGFLTTDMGVQAHVRLPAGNTTATLLARARLSAGKLTAYEGRLTRLNGVVTLQLVRTVAGSATVLRSVNLSPLSEGMLRLETQGNRIRLLLDGQQRIDVTDTAIALAGQAGVAGTTNVSIDDFQATTTGPGLPLELTGETASLGSGWQTLAGAFGVTGNQVRAGAVASTAVYTAASLRDVTLEAGYALAVGQSASLLLRHNGTGNTRSYYEASLTRSATGTTLQLHRVVAGKRTTLRTVTGVGATGTLRFSALGTTLSLSLDGTPVIEITDTALGGAGLVGISATAQTTLTDLQA